MTDHGDWKEILETLREKFTKYVLPRFPTYFINALANYDDRVNLPKTFTAVNLSEKGVFRDRATIDKESIED